jgi:hypothetical protein
LAAASLITIAATILQNPFWITAARLQTNYSCSRFPVDLL